MTTETELYDIVISFDTTGSMRRCLQNVKDKMQGMMRKLRNDIPGIRIGVIAHGDYDTDHTYIIKHEDLTDDVQRLCNFTKAVQGTGGGITSEDTLDEAYELALKYCRTKISWRCGSNRALIMIGDCRPHEKDFHMNEENIDWTEEIKLLREKDVKIYAIQCEGREYADTFYHKIASFTFGHHQELKDFSKVEQVIMSICYREAGLLQASSQTVIKRETKTQNLVIETDDSDEEENEEDVHGLICQRCKKRKPHNEFPTVSVSEKCEHFPGVCLRCVVEHVVTEGTCPLHNYPHVNDDAKVSPSSLQMQIFQATLDEMFIDYTKVYEETRKKLLSSKGNKIIVYSMSGDTAWLDYDPELTIAALKKEVQRQTGVSEGDQKILYKEKKLMSSRTLSNYKIGANESLSMIIPLYNIPENLDHVVFDLSWEFSDQSKDFDFLDASCFAFQNTEFIQVIDWNHPENKFYLKGSIKHTEKNETTAGGRIGHQTIEVHLQRVPSDISHLFFTLSSWKAPNLAAFTNPTLNFYQATDTEKNLCETTLSHALDSQAVIMCYVVRTNNKWQIFECDTNSCVDGNSKKYNPIRRRISDLIEDE